MKYAVDKWIHAHYIVEIEADSFEDAKWLAENYETENESKLTINDFDIGDGGITCITDENGNELWCD